MTDFSLETITNFMSTLSATLIIVTACSTEPESLRTVVNGKITVADSLDDSRDYSGIGVTIVKQDSANAEIDTLFNANTDVNGSFMGEVEFPQKSFYSMLISRNNNDIASLRVILADNDTLNISAELPEITRTLKL